MPNNRYIQFKVNNKDVYLGNPEDLALDINYSLENSDDFQSKESSSALSVTVPATTNNDSVFDGFHDPNIESDAIKHAASCLMVEDGVEIFKGKALLTNAIKMNDRPSSYSLDCYGNNGDWILPLKDKTLHDFISQHTHILNNAIINGSWSYFDGRDESFDFVYAPVRYGTKFSSNDEVIKPLELKPSISIYWIIWRAFKSLGYKIESTFLDTDYFRRMVMPWTWGDFLFMDSSKLDPLKFKATGTVYPVNDPNYDGLSRSWVQIQNAGTHNLTLGNMSGGGNVTVVQDDFELKNDAPPLGFDNGNNYHDDGIFKYYKFNSTQASLLGVTDIVFTINIPSYINASAGLGPIPTVEIWLKWNIQSSNPTSGQVFLYSAATNNGAWQNDEIEFTVPNVNPGETIVFRIDIHYDGIGPYQQCSVQEASRFSDSFGLHEAFFRVKSFKKTAGSIVDFTIYDEFKNYNILDLLGGVADAFDLEFQTDPINKIVKIEPCYPYYLNNNPDAKTPGYFNPNSKIDWTSKRDLIEQSTLELYRDVEQLLEFKFKDDGNDGGVKIFNERFSRIAGSSKYFFPDRFKEGTKEIENRFFSPVVHVQMKQWDKYSTNRIAPQLIALIPENIANTSADESQNSFQPKIAYYKGPGDNHNNGRINYDGQLNSDGTGIWNCPEMFAVNYQQGGENDPVLTYCDQNINAVVCHGLMRRFFLPRLAVQRYGKRLTASFHLGMLDITNWYHREQIIIDNAVYYLVNINGYKPTKEQSTECVLWKYHPITKEDSDNCFPSISSVETGTQISTNDLTSNQLLLLQTDISPE